MNKRYIKGIMHERAILNWHKAMGMTGTRSSGSHGLWDLTILTELGYIKLIQVKSGKYSNGELKKDLAELSKLRTVNNVFLYIWVHIKGNTYDIYNAKKSIMEHERICI